jgi:probable HAF family extracellular repeat protein
MQSWKTWAVAVLAVGLGCSVPAGAAVRYTVTDLSAASGLRGAMDINNAGQIIGWAYTGAVDEYGKPALHAALWENGHTTDLHTFGVCNSYAQAVNNQGQAVGFYVRSDSSGGFLWNGGSQDLGIYADAKAINDLGQIVGAGGVPSGNAVLRDGANVTDLGALGTHGSWPTAINNRTQVIGGSWTPEGEAHIFLWENGQIHDLQDISTAPAGWELYWASAINDVGQIVGHASLPDGTYHSFVWEDGVVQDLGAAVSAYDINNLGQIVGSLPGAAPLQLGHAVLWENGVMADLNDLIPVGSGLLLTDAYRVNDVGQILAEAYANGVEYPVLLTPVPEPATAALAAIAAVFSLRSRKH